MTTTESTLSRRGGGLVLAVLYVGLALLLARAHHEKIDAPREEKRLALHAAVLENRAPDPYQYKLFAITWAVEGVHRATGVSVFDLYMANTSLALLALLVAHHAWLSRLYGARAALLGTLLLCALAHVLFLGYYHHPYEFWGVAGFCVLLRSIVGRASIVGIAGFSLVLGVVWEKHALLPLVYALCARRDGAAWPGVLTKSAALFACSIAFYVGVRVVLGGNRALVDGDTTLALQQWGLVVAHHAPYVFPFALMLVVAWRRVPFVVRCAWLYVPAMLVAYAASQFILHEIRSFWAFAPIFTATAAAWAAGLPDEPAGITSPEGDRQP